MTDLSDYRRYEAESAERTWKNIAAMVDNAKRLAFLDGFHAALAALSYAYENPKLSAHADYSKAILYLRAVAANDYAIPEDAA